MMLVVIQAAILFFSEPRRFSGCCSRGDVREALPGNAKNVSTVVSQRSVGPSSGDGIRVGRRYIVGVFRSIQTFRLVRRGRQSLQAVR